MADFSTSYNFVMDNEDAARQYKVVPDAPPGAYSISGINSVAFPEDFDRINSLDVENRAPAVELFYRNTFWNTWFDQLSSTELAKRVLDSEVNMGAGTGVKILQTACNNLIPGTLVVDGEWGVNTLKISNNMCVTPLAEKQMVTAFIAQRVQHYEDIIALHPADAKYRQIWEERARK